MYCQPEEVRHILDDADIPNGRLLAIIPAICEGIDGWCKRSFTPETKTRLYDYTDSQKIKLREGLVSITTVTTNAGQTFGSSDFLLLPNDDPPYYWIKLKQGKYFSYSGTTEQAISITAQWGYQVKVPQRIITAAKIWTAIVYNNLDQLGFESISTGDLKAKVKELTEEPPKEVQSMINNFRHIRVGSVR